MRNLARLAIVAAASAGLMITQAWAASGQGGVFTIHNNSASNVVVGFYTNDGSGWSTNWLGEHLAPNEKAEAEFSDDTGNCNQTLQVGWLGTENQEVMDDPININICEATNVYLGDNEITFD